MKLLDFPPKAEPTAVVATTLTIQLIDSDQYLIRAQSYDY
jgi:hypothetical protein